MKLHERGFTQSEHTVFIINSSFLAHGFSPLKTTQVNNLSVSVLVSIYASVSVFNGCLHCEAWSLPKELHCEDKPTRLADVYFSGRLCFQLKLNT